MSIKIRWLTNGDKTVYTVRDFLNGTFDVVEDIKEIPEEIRHYAENIEEPTFCEPDLARMFDVTDVFYPDWPKKCNHPEYSEEYCVAESCRYGGKNKGWEKCKYFNDEKWEGYRKDSYCD